PPVSINRPLMPRAVRPSGLRNQRPGGPKQMTVPSNTRLSPTSGRSKSGVGGGSAGRYVGLGGATGAMACGASFGAGATAAARTGWAWGRTGAAGGAAGGTYVTVSARQTGCGEGTALAGGREAAAGLRDPRTELPCCGLRLIAQFASQLSGVPL